MGKRFQAKKLNKDDHKDVKETARAVKKSVGIASALVSRFCGYDRNGIACRRGDRLEMVRYRYGKRND